MKVMLLVTQLFVLPLRLTFNGLQTGCRKYRCFLCKCDSRGRIEYYTPSKWPPRDTVTQGSHDAVNFTGQTTKRCEQKYDEKLYSWTSFFYSNAATSSHHNFKKIAIKNMQSNLCITEANHKVMIA